MVASLVNVPDPVVLTIFSLASSSSSAPLLVCNSLSVTHKKQRPTSYSSVPGGSGDMPYYIHPWKDPAFGPPVRQAGGREGGREGAHLVTHLFSFPLDSTRSSTKPSALCLPRSFAVTPCFNRWPFRACFPRSTERG